MPQFCTNRNRIGPNGHSTAPWMWNTKAKVSKARPLLDGTGQGNWTFELELESGMAWIS